MKSKLFYQKALLNVTKAIASLCVFVVCTGCPGGGDDDKFFKELAVSESSIKSSCLDGVEFFYIESNTSWTVSLSSGASSWLTVSTTSGSGDEQIEVAFSKNTTQYPRKATITISGDDAAPITVTVNQSAPTLVRFKKESFSEILTAMRLYDVDNSMTAVRHNFYSASNDESTYYSLVPGTYRPEFYFSIEGGAWFSQKDLPSYNFQEGKSYTVSFGSGLSVTVD